MIPAHQPSLQGTMLNIKSNITGTQAVLNNVRILPVGFCESQVGVYTATGWILSVFTHTKHLLMAIECVHFRK